MDDAANRIESIFAEALRQPAAQRVAFLAGACKNDARLLARVEALLKAHDAAGAFMAPSADDVVATIDGIPGIDAVPLRQAGPEGLFTEKPGTVIGHYKLLQRIGEGGFGVVWMADQEKPVRRRVALKIIKMGMDTKEVIARFEQERQALAMMDHPNIARVLDAGATQTGRPYFVMELVRGVKITEYCDDQGLSTAERIELFITVCQAVQHAHQKGIIHRDLKPSNILVTINDGEAVPKVIDFGVAKATQGRLTEGTLFTQFEQMIGTPLYMSPEQAEITSLDVDTRSDIYALGVLLYELLTGRTPIDTATMAKAGMDEVRRLIREVDPPRPSARLKTLAGNELTSMAKRRHTDATKLPGALRGDIDWIVMKCLEKDRKRRYDTANGLAMDLQRHLRNDVVMARPPTTAYLLSKLVRRNKIACIAGAAIAASLVIGIAASVWQAVRADREASRAKSAEQRAVAALDELRATAPAFAEQARALAAKEKFDEAIEKLDYALKLRPDAGEYLVAKGDLLQGAPISILSLVGTPDLTPLRGMAIKKLWLTGTMVTDLNPLKGMPLERLSLSANTNVTDLSALRGMPLIELWFHDCSEIVDVSPLADSKALQSIVLPPNAKNFDFLRAFPKLERISFNDDSKNGYRPDKTAAEFWKEYGQTWAMALRNAGMKYTAHQDAAGMWSVTVTSKDFSDCSIFKGAPIRELNLLGTRVADLRPLGEIALSKLDVRDTPVTDLSALRAPSLSGSLQEVYLWKTQVTDFSPLAACTKLEVLDVSGCPLADLSIVRGRKLRVIHLRDAKIADISILAGMPLTRVSLGGTAVTDLSPLLQCPTLEELVLPAAARNVDALRALPALTALSYKTRAGGFPTQKAEEFWTTYEHDLPQIHARAGRWAEARNAFEKAIRVNPDDNDNWYRLALLLAHVDDRAAYRAHCHAMLERFGKTAKPEEMERTAKTSLLLPLDDADSAEAIRLANSAAAMKDHRFISYFRFAQAFGQYRSADYLPAVATLTEIAKTGADVLVVQSEAVLSMAQHRLGQRAKAQSTLTLAENRAAEKLPQADAPDLGPLWNDVLLARMLLREARDAIGKK